MAAEKNLYSKLLQLFEKHLLHKYLDDLIILSTFVMPEVVDRVSEL